MKRFVPSHFSWWMWNSCVCDGGWLSLRLELVFAVDVIDCAE